MPEIVKVRIRISRQAIVIAFQADRFPCRPGNLSIVGVITDSTVIIIDEMNRHPVLGCAIALACIVSAAHSQELKLPKGTVCWPLHFSGITLGLTTDSEVQRLLGKGVARKNEGDTGGRYFVDEGHTATLHAVSYTDSVVGDLTLRAGVDPAIHASEVKQAESKWFKPADGFGNWHALHLGSSRDDVLKNLGEPKKRVAANDWQYETICECELEEFFDVFFKDNRVVKVVFSAPAG